MQTFLSSLTIQKTTLNVQKCEIKMKFFLILIIIVRQRLIVIDELLKVHISLWILLLDIDLMLGLKMNNEFNSGENCSWADVKNLIKSIVVELKIVAGIPNRNFTLHKKPSFKNYWLLRRHKFCKNFQL